MEVSHGGVPWRYAMEVSHVILISCQRFVQVLGRSWTVEITLLSVLFLSSKWTTFASSKRTNN